MKKELVKIFNKKLGDINSNIKALEELNKNINEENDKLSFIDRIIGLFKEDDQNNLMNFAKIDKDEFLSVLEIVGEEVRKIFSGDSCNYDGLVYLINGINSGVSITLTDEQKNSIEYLIKSMEDKKKEMVSTIDGYELLKSRYEVSDVSELNDLKNQYSKVVEDVDKGNYIKDINLLKDAISFSQLSPEETINILSYVLEYNVDVFKEGKVVEEEPVEEKEEKKEEPKEEIKEEPKEEPASEVPKEEEVKEETKEADEFNFRQVENNNLFDLPNITFDDEPTANNNAEETETPEQEEAKVEEPEVKEEPKEEVKEEPKEEPAPEAPKEEEIKEEEKPQEPESDEIPSELTYVPETDEVVETVSPKPLEELSPEAVSLPPLDKVEEEKPLEEVKVEEPVEVPTPPVEEAPKEEEKIDNDFKDVINSKVDYETREKQEEEKTSTRELHKVFGKYGIEENVILNELIDGNITEYQHTLDTLKDHNILDYFKKNKELLVETLLYSNASVIDKVLRIIKEDLSVDDEDYAITLKIVINTIPSIFVKEGGNYDNFVQNVELFKDLEINLINLFDFSKEIFVADSEHIKNNLDVVNKYDFDINYKNAKYFLLIPNIAEKLDYYIESVYEDKTKNATFDGVNYIKEYAAKLNVVTDETIKRLRYASSTGAKVFGNKPGSLSGEITNLKVNALAITDEYMKGFFNNEFTTLTSDEVREYIKLVRNSSNVGDYSDELDKLNTYKNGLRYVIDGINVSCNKVVRNYNILRSYGIDSKKALQFAVCYNLVITKDEYNKLSEMLDKIGGNA